MFSLIKKIKDIKTLILTHLQQLRDESQASLRNDELLLKNNELILKNNELILKNDDSILSNDISLLNASKHLIEMLNNQHQETQKLHADLTRQIQYLRYQDQQHRDALLMLISETKTQAMSTLPQHFDPDVALMSYLYSYLPSRIALDIGANVGEVSAELLKVGYEVYAFEPFPPIFKELKQRLEKYSNFHPMEVAIGSTDGIMTLHIATCTAEDPQKYSDPSLYNTLKPHSTWDDLPFQDVVQVNVRSLESLYASQEIPSEVGLVKIDTEGFDLEVIRGMGNFRYPVVVSEFWDRELIFQQSKDESEIVLLEDIVREMKQRGYYWYIVICRDAETGKASFYSNYDQTPFRSWGNTFFFQEYATFSQALRWCLVALPQSHVFH